MSSALDFTIVTGDIARFSADLVAMKYAQAFHGADEAVARTLVGVGIPEESLCPPVGESRLLETRQGIVSPKVIFVGLRRLHQLGYQDIRELSIATLRAVTEQAPEARHLAMTIHGPGFGLDEVESALSQVSGVLEWMDAAGGDSTLDRISLVEIRPDRVDRLRAAFERVFAETDDAKRLPGDWTYRLGRTRSRLTAAPVRRSQAIESAGPQSAAKPSVFVAMPFAKELDDVFYYGIQQPTHATGFLCERVDQEAFTGDVLARVKERIQGAALVIAELTGANPNVYLEVGYAWGMGRPTILIAKSAEELKFDVRGQRCLTYSRIRDLEELLRGELNQLKTKAGGIPGRG